MANFDWVRLLFEDIDLRVVANAGGAAIFDGAKYLGRIVGPKAAEAVLDALKTTD